MLPQEGGGGGQGRRRHVAGADALSAAGAGGQADAHDAFGSGAGAAALRDVVVAGNTAEAHSADDCASSADAGGSAHLRPRWRPAAGTSVTPSEGRGSAALTAALSRAAAARWSHKPVASSQGRRQVTAGPPSAGEPTLFKRL
jgi:hypothetical protein